MLDIREGGPNVGSSKTRSYEATPLECAILSQLGVGRAFLLNRGVVWHAQGEGQWSSVVALIQGIYEVAPEDAHFLLRRRILTGASASRFDRAMVKVCAKKLTDKVVPVEETPPPELEYRDVTEAAHRLWASNAGRLDVPEGLAGEALLQWMREGCQVEGQGPRFRRARPVVACLVDPHGQVWGAARNTNGLNKTLHAEVNLLQRFSSAEKEPLGPGWTLWVTLQSCRMCAAMVEYLAPAGLQVRFGEPETGRFGRGTRLQALGWESPWPESQAKGS